MSVKRINMKGLEFSANLRRALVLIPCTVDPPEGFLAPESQMHNVRCGLHKSSSGGPTCWHNLIEMLGELLHGLACKRCKVLAGASSISSLHASCSKIRLVTVRTILVNQYLDRRVLDCRHDATRRGNLLHTSCS